VLCAHPPAPVGVSIHEKVVRGATTYTFRVVNRTRQPIVALRIGYNAARQEPQLTTLPPQWTFERGLAPGTAAAPAGWSVRLVTTEENPKFMLEWTSERGPKSDIRPGKSERSFRITLAHPARDYRQAMFEVTLADSTRLRGTLTPACEHDIATTPIRIR